MEFREEINKGGDCTQVNEFSRLVHPALTGAKLPRRPHIVEPLQSVHENARHLRV